MTDLQKKAEEIYRRMTSYANYSEMNGISKKWIIEKIEEGLQEYHRAELLKLNKSDVISSLRQCTNCVHYRDNFDCDTCNEYLDKWQSNDL